MDNIDIISIIGTVASVCGITFSAYVFFRNMDNIAIRIRKSIVIDILKNQNLYDSLKPVHIENIIKSRSSQNKLKARDITYLEIIEDITSEIISSPFINDETRKVYLEKIENIYLETIGLDKANLNLKKEKQIFIFKNISSLFGLIGSIVTILAILSLDYIERVLGFSNEEKELTIFVTSGIAALVTLILTIVIGSILNKRK